MRCSSLVKKLTGDELRENTSLEEGKYLLEQKGMDLKKFLSMSFFSTSLSEKPLTEGYCPCGASGQIPHSTSKKELTRFM